MFEGLYSDFDSLMAPLLKKIIDSKSTEPPPLDLEERWKMMLCLGFLYWRVPSRDAQGKELVNRFGFRSDFFNIHDKKTGKPISDEEMRKIAGFDGMDTAYKMGLSFAPFYSAESYKTAQHWKFLYQDPGFHITGDNPILCRKDAQDFKEILDEFIFPVSSGMSYHQQQTLPKPKPWARFLLQVECGDH